MIGTATVTAKTGPGLTITAQALANVTAIRFNIAAETVEFDYTPSIGPPRTLVVSMSDLSTITSTVVEGASLDVVVTNA